MPSYRNLVFSGSSSRSSTFTLPGSRLDSGRPVDEVAIHVVALTVEEDLVRIGYCPHCHLTNSIIGDCFFGEVHFLSPFTWEPSLPAVISAPLKFSLAPISFRSLTSF